MHLASILGIGCLIKMVKQQEKIRQILREELKFREEVKMRKQDPPEPLILLFFALLGAFLAGIGIYFLAKYLGVFG